MIWTLETLSSFGKLRAKDLRFCPPLFLSLLYGIWVQIQFIIHRLGLCQGIGLIIDGLFNKNQTKRSWRRWTKGVRVRQDLTLTKIANNQG